VSNPLPPTAPSATPPGWFPDPLERYEHRYFNGTTWTSDVSNNGQRMVDPLGTGPGYGATGPQQGNGMATAALTCGIIGTLVAWIPFVVVVGIALGILALVFGIKGLRRSGIVGSGRGLAIAGIITGAVTLLLSVLGIVLSVLLFRAVSDFSQPGPVDTDVTSCEIDGRNATAQGTLTNESRSTRDYTLFVSVGGETDVATFEDVSPGETVEWVARIRTRTLVEDCRTTVVVQGPFPFGIEIDPIES
jgi:hypothetical protein